MCFRRAPRERITAMRRAHADASQRHARHTPRSRAYRSLRSSEALFACLSSDAHRAEQNRSALQSNTKTNAGGADATRVSTFSSTLFLFLFL
jgi:hypothetical protein